MDADGYRSGRQEAYNLHAHIVPTPEYRTKVTTARVAAELRAAFEEVCVRYQATLDAFETDRDHAHLLVSYPPKVALFSAGPSAPLARDPPGAVGRAVLVAVVLHSCRAAQPSYCVVSCGGDPLEVVKASCRGPERS